MARIIVHSPKMDVNSVVCGKVIVMIFSMIFKLGLPKTYICQILDLRSMDWSNRFTFGGFIIFYNKLHQMWEVITERDGIEVSYPWFGTKEKAEAFLYGEILSDYNSDHLLKRFSHFHYFLKSFKSVLMETKIVTKC